MNEIEEEEDEEPEPEPEITTQVTDYSEIIARDFFDFLSQRQSAIGASRSRIRAKAEMIDEPTTSNSIKDEYIPADDDEELMYMHDDDNELPQKKQKTKSKTTTRRSKKKLK